MNENQNQNSETFIGHFSLPSVSFMVCGESEVHALRLAEAAWNKHCSDNGIRLKWSDVEHRVYVIKMAPGQIQKLS